MVRHSRHHAARAAWLLSPSRSLSLAALLAALAGPAGAATPATRPMQIGTTTHFGQGWPVRAWGALESSTAVTVRDGVRWPLVEKTPGVYDFSDKLFGHLDRICNGGRKLILMTKMQNPIYDDGNVVASTAAREAFGNYLAALTGRYRDCAVAIEIGNEVNAGKIMAIDPNRFYVNILKSIYPKIKAAAPDVAVLGASSNTVATGWIRDLAKVGLLDAVDGIAIHPYRRDPINVDWELERLHNVIAAAARPGRRIPIWITEFSKFFNSNEEAPDFFAKMVAMMSSVGVEQAQWYALLDFSAVGTMGQYDKDAVQAPVGKAIDYWQTNVLPGGAAVRVASADPTLFHYRFGPNWQVVWSSSGRSIAVTGATSIRNSRGDIIALPARLGNEPILIEGAATVTLGEGDVVADSLVSYARAPWTYFGQRLTQPTRQFSVVDWKWSSFLSYSFMRPSAINHLAYVTGGGIKAPITLTMRYTAPAAAELIAVACLNYRSSTPGIALEIRSGGATLATRQIGHESVRVAVPVSLAAGGTVDFVTRPTSRGEIHNYWYRYRLIKAGAPLPHCPIPGSSSDDPDFVEG